LENDSARRRRRLVGNDNVGRRQLLVHGARNAVRFNLRRVLDRSAHVLVSHGMYTGKERTRVCFLKNLASEDHYKHSRTTTFHMLSFQQGGCASGYREMHTDVCFGFALREVCERWETVETGTCLRLRPNALPLPGGAAIAGGSGGGDVVREAADELADNEQAVSNEGWAVIGLASALGLLLAAGCCVYARRRRRKHAAQHRYADVDVEGQANANQRGESATWNNSNENGEKWTGNESGEPGETGEGETGELGVVVVEGGETNDGEVGGPADAAGAVETGDNDDTVTVAETPPPLPPRGRGGGKQEQDGGEDDPLFDSEEGLNSDKQRMTAEDTRGGFQF
jgi:hypothetical protein